MTCHSTFLKAAFVFLAICPALAYAEKAKNVKQKLPPLLQEIEGKYTKANTVFAEFVQVNETAALSQKKTSSGLLMAKRPNKVRWETLQPDQNLLVFNGRTFWYYTPPIDEGENGQVIERKSSAVQSRLANALLSGSFSIARDMKIEKKSASSFVLTPKAGTAGTVIKAKNDVNTEKKLIQKVTLSHRGGNRSEITLSKIELGKKLTDELFIFTPPPNTDRIQE